MLGSKLLGIGLSLLLTVTPVNKYNEITYPFTRPDSLFYRFNYEVFDLGTTTANGNTHNYDVRYTVDIWCSSACSLDPHAYTNGLLESHVQYVFSKRIMNITSESLANRFSGMSTANAITQNQTYQSASQSNGIQFNVTYDNGQTQSVTVWFIAEPFTQRIDNTNYLINELSNLYFMKEFLMDKDTDSQTIQTVQNYLNNGDYSSAYTYIQNYYYQNSVSQNENNETVVNNYESKETNFQTLFNTENNFSNQVETDFNNRMNNIDLTPSLPSQNSFLQSANWVTTQFNRLTNNNAFGQLLGFSLIIGLLLALIGRFLA